MGALGDLEDVLDAEVGRDRRLAAADQVGLVGLVAVQGQLVLFGIDRNRIDSELSAGAKNSDRDLTPIRRHDFTEFLN